jgi:hypothetical protein
MCREAVVVTAVLALAGGTARNQDGQQTGNQTRYSSYRKKECQALDCGIASKSQLSY